MKIYLPNPPIQSEVIISIGGYQDIFTVRSQESDVTNITDGDLKKFRDSYSRSSVSFVFGILSGFLATYGAFFWTKIFEYMYLRKNSLQL